MGKHGTGYARVGRDHYPTPYWVIAALAEWLELRGLTVWEPACGDGGMAAALRQQSCARVHNLRPRKLRERPGRDARLPAARNPQLERFDAIITNPPFGQGGTLATAFIRAGLKRLGPSGMLALLLPADFDSAKTRARYFADHPWFAAKIALTRRIVWFERSDGVRVAPKENHSWFVWRRSPLRVRQAPVILYAPGNAAAELALEEAARADHARACDAGRGDIQAPARWQTEG